MSKNSFIECTILFLRPVHRGVHKKEVLVVSPVDISVIPYENNTIHARARCCAYHAEMAGVFAINNFISI